MFANVSDHNLQKIGSEKVWHIQGASLVVSTYAKNDPCVCAFSHIFCRASQSSVTHIKVGKILQTVLNILRRCTVATLDIKTPFLLGIHMFFYSIAMIEDDIYARTLKCSRSLSKRTIFGYTVEKSLNAWTALVPDANIALLAKLVSPYILFCSVINRCLVL